MEFTVIGHACLRVETTGPTVLVDPWLFGSCYWRSWWHFPEEAELPDEWLAPDVIYLTHHHFDHFHYPSLRRLAKQATVVVPRVGVDVMVGELNGLGFHDVVEVPHGERLDLGRGAGLTSYQYGFDDTAVVIDDRNATLVDLNDCKIRGPALDQLRADHPTPTFMFKTHSWAQSYPNLYTADDPADLGLVERSTYIDEFVGAADHLRPTYAVPFANMVGFLHPESWAVNAAMITPEEVQVAFDERGPAGTEFVTMSPGDRWSSADGFDRSDENWWDDRLPRMAARAAELAPTFDAVAEEEATRPLAFEQFQEYLEEFLGALPRPIRRRLLPRPLVFVQPGDHDGDHWVVDGARGRVTRADAAPPDTAAFISIAPGVLADALPNRILHFVHGSMRLRTHLRPGGARSDLAFWGLVAVWEIGYLPIRKSLRPRAVRTALRRRRELAEMAGALLRPGDAFSRLAEGLARPAEEAVS